MLRYGLLLNVLISIMRELVSVFEENGALENQIVEVKLLCLAV